jgi:hypothetical protein
LINANGPAKDWCYAVEHAADLYRVTLHFAIKMSPFQAWYGELPNYKDTRIWGCRMLVPNHGTKNSEDRASLGYFYGYAKSCFLPRWCDDSTDNGTFLEIYPLHPEPSPVKELLGLD